MPEIAEVEYARQRCHKYCVGGKIVKVETQPDPLILSGRTSEEFNSTLENKTVMDTKRWGKYFVLCNEPHFVGHFGMTGDLVFQHELEKDATWPPRFWKMIITFEKKDGTSVVMAFKDARRLGRLRLVQGDPLKQEPISKLGFDPLHNLPESEEFYALVHKRKMPIKALLLDQAFSAGVGNWVADEILYQSKIHPAQPADTLSPEECNTLRKQMERVCRIAVEAEADSSLFPDDWLMTYRWNKGKGKGNGVLPSGHKLAFETVGGRTSAFVPALQKLRQTTKVKKSRTSIKEEKISTVLVTQKRKMTTIQQADTKRRRYTQRKEQVSTVSRAKSTAANTKETGPTPRELRYARRVRSKEQ